MCLGKQTQKKMSDVCRTLDGDKPYVKNKKKNSSRVWLSAAASRKVDPGPPVDSTTVLSLFVEAWVSWPSGGERGIVVTPLLCHGVVRAMERCPPPYPSHLRWERKPTLPAPSLGRRVELTLLTEAWGCLETSLRT